MGVLDERRGQDPVRLRAAVLVAAAALSCGVRDDGYPALEKSLASILATVSGTSGEVQVKHAAQGVWESAVTATPLYPGDWVRTGRGAWARLDFLNGSALELEEDAVLVVEALKPLEAPGPDLPQSAPLVALEAGSVRSTLANHAGAARPLFLRTADGVQTRVERKAESGPAELRVARVGRATEVSVSRGEVRLASAKTEHLVEAGAAASLEREGAKTVSLLGAPALAAPEPEARSRFDQAVPPGLRWAEVPGATVYRVQVASDPTFRKVALARDVGEPGLDAPLERPGVYWWRVAARDEEGRQSLFAPARRFFLEREAPVDALLEPPDGSAWGFGATAPRIRFSWRPREGVKAYRLVVGKSADLLGAAVAAEVVGEPQAQLDALQPGEYFWGVFVQGANLEPLFLTPRRLTVKKVAGSNLVVPKKIKKWGD